MVVLLAAGAFGFIFGGFGFCICLVVALVCV